MVNVLVHVHRAFMPLKVLKDLYVSNVLKIVHHVLQGIVWIVMQTFSCIEENAMNLALLEQLLM